MREFLRILLLILAAGSAAGEDAPETLDDAIERLRLELVSASNYRSPWDSLNPSDRVRRQYLEYANSLIFVKKSATGESSIALLHDILPRITSISGRELIEPHISVSNAVVQLHEDISQYEIQGIKDYYLAHTPLILSRGSGGTITIHGNFKTINKNHEPIISIEGRNVTPIDVTDTDIVFDVPEDLLENVEELRFSIVAGRSFRPLELVLIRKTIRDKRRLYVRSENPLVGSIRWFVPPPGGTQTFSTVIERPIELTVDRPTPVSESFSVAELLALSDPEAIPATEFSSVRIVDLRWNSKVVHASSGCERPSTVISWTRDLVRAYTKILPRPDATVRKEKSSSNAKLLRQKRAYTKILPRPDARVLRKASSNAKLPPPKGAPISTCSVAIGVFLAPVFEGLVPATELDTFDSEYTFSVPYAESIEISPPHPAFWRGILELEYDAGPLSFLVRMQIASQDEPRIVTLPDWQVSLQTDTPTIRYHAVE